MPREILTLRKTREPGTSVCTVSAARNSHLEEDDRTRNICLRGECRAKSHLEEEDRTRTICLRVNAARNSHLEEDDGMFAGIGEEQLSEVGTAGGQNQFVGLELVPVCRQGHVCEFAILTDEEELNGKDKKPVVLRLLTGVKYLLTSVKAENLPPAAEFIDPEWG